MSGFKSLFILMLHLVYNKAEREMKEINSTVPVNYDLSLILSLWRLNLQSNINHIFVFPLFCLPLISGYSPIKMFTVEAAEERRDDFIWLFAWNFWLTML